MAQTSHRVLALGMAIFFLLTAIAGGGAVLWQIYEDNQIANSANNSSEEVQVADANTTQLDGFEPRDSVSELEVVDLVEGDGNEVKADATVKAHYTGALVKDGTVFQSSRDFGDEPIEFPLNGVIPGWTQGVPGMKVGGKRRLVIPADLAYGANPPSQDIPPNADLVFDIEIVEVKNP